MTDITFSDKENKLMATAWLCFHETPKVSYLQIHSCRTCSHVQINFDKLAPLNGYTNTRSCSNAWGNIKKKLAALQSDAVDGTGAGSNGDGDTLKPMAKATPKKRGKKAAHEDEVGEHDDDESPAKKVKATPRKRTATPKKLAQQAQEEDDQDEVKTEKSDADDLP